MKKILLTQKITSALIALLILGLPGFLLIPSVSAATPDWDVNSDGSCSILDLVLISNHMGETGAPGWIREDVDNNGDVQLLDMVLVSNHYGESGWNNDTARIQKMLIAYSNYMSLPACRQFAADHFDLIDMNPNLNTYALEIKANAVNSNIKIIGYFDASFEPSGSSDWETVNANEPWFIHDNYPQTTGNRVHPSGYPNNYLMGPNDGWGTYWAQRCQNMLTSNPAYDGIFADDVVNGYEGLNAYGLSPNPPATVYTNYPTWQKNQLQLAKNTIGTKILMPNLYRDDITDVPSVTGVYFWEGFIHSRDQSHIENGYGTDGWNYGRMCIDNYLHPAAEAGYIIATNSGVSDYNSYPTEGQHWCEFCYAMFAFAVVDPSKAYFSWMFYGWDDSNGYLSTPMDLLLGNPIDEYNHIADTPQVYTRNFDNYYVIANMNLLGTGSVTFTLPYNGVQYTLPPRQALFIQK